ncbi:MAG: hypothetical protein LBV41_06820, partial [Cytophagaceae bacterium]|nr:hypothetical protein [Cytophagaceae bacterium]
MKKIYTVLILLSLSATFLKAQVLLPYTNIFPDTGSVIIAPAFRFNLGIFENDSRKTMGEVNSIANDYQKALLMLTQADPRSSSGGLLYLGISTAKIASSSSFGISAVRGLYYTSPDHIFSTTRKTNAFVINNAGNVGIGTSSPSQQLHVVGNGKFSGDMWVNNTHKVATLSQDQTFTGVQTFNSDVFSNGNRYFNTDGLKSLWIRNASMNTTLQVGIAEDTYHYHFSSKRGDIVIRRLGSGEHKRLIISTATTPNSDQQQAVGILGADSKEGDGIWVHNNLNVRIGAYSATAPTHKLEVNG